VNGHDDWFKGAIPKRMQMPEKVKPKHFNKVFEKYNAEKASTIVKHTVDYLPSSNMAYSAIFDDSEDCFNGDGYSDLKLAYGQSILN
jgi:hypothetical protein